MSVQCLCRNFIFVQNQNSPVFLNVIIDPGFLLQSSQTNTGFGGISKLFCFYYSKFSFMFCTCSHLPGSIIFVYFSNFFFKTQLCACPLCRQYLIYSSNFHLNSQISPKIKSMQYTNFFHLFIFAQNIHWE